MAQTYIVQGTINRGPQEVYRHGTEFPPVGVVVSDDEIAQLVEAGALKLPAEVLPAAALEAERQHLEAENTALRDRLAALELQMAAQPTKAKKAEGAE